MSDDGIRCRIIGKHPHAGATGHIEVVNGFVQYPPLAGLSKPDMFKVLLDDNDAGVDACFATKQDVEVLIDGRWCRSRK